MSVSDKVKKKLQELPDKPGVYFMRNRQGKIIYVGKALSLRSRVRSYFQRGTLKSAVPKLRGLINSIEDLDFLVVRTEAEAILTEGRLIKEYRPHYNAFFKDDKRFLLIRVNLKEPFPRFEPYRIQKNDGATYFGPYTNSAAARAALEFMERRFGLRQCRPLIPDAEDHKHCHNDIVRFCSAPCIANVSPEEYRERVETACAFLRGERPEILREIREAMEREAASKHYEKAAALRDTLFLLQHAIKERAKGRKNLTVKSQEALDGVFELQSVLGLKKEPRMIECFDISNISGTHAVASMVCSVDGMPCRNRYRLFRIKTVIGIDDPAMMAEVIRRRYTRVLNEKKTLPDLIIVDGGITQLKAARQELAALNLLDIPSIGLAKRFEEIYYCDDLTVPTIRLSSDSKALIVLKQIRDEAHRFALTYHRKLRFKRIRESVLDEIEGVGEKRKQVLLAKFGSLTRLQKASVEEIAAVGGIGKVLAEQIKKRI